MRIATEPEGRERQSSSSSDPSSVSLSFCNLLVKTSVYGDRGEAMYAAIAILGLSFLLTFFGVGVSEAEVWICSQPGGGALFTDVPQTDGSCEQHAPASQWK